MYPGLSCTYNALRILPIVGGPEFAVFFKFSISSVVSCMPILKKWFCDIFLLPVGTPEDREKLTIERLIFGARYSGCSNKKCGMWLDELDAGSGCSDWLLLLDDAALLLPLLLLLGSELLNRTLLAAGEYPIGCRMVLSLGCGSAANSGLGRTWLECKIPELAYTLCTLPGLSSVRMVMPVRSVITFSLLIRVFIHSCGPDDVYLPASKRKGASRGRPAFKEQCPYSNPIEVREAFNKTLVWSVYVLRIVPYSDILISSEPC